MSGANCGCLLNLDTKKKGPGQLLVIPEWWRDHLISFALGHGKPKVGSVDVFFPKLCHNNVVAGFMKSSPRFYRHEVFGKQRNKKASRLVPRILKVPIKRLTRHQFVFLTKRGKEIGTSVVAKISRVKLQRKRMIALQISTLHCRLLGHRCELANHAASHEHNSCLTGQPMLGCHMDANVVDHLLRQYVVIIVAQVVVVHGWMVYGFGSNCQLDWKLRATCFFVDRGGRGRQGGGG
jgi:hypothetical protein